MLKKIAFFSLLCIATTHAGNWKTDTVSKLANSSLIVGTFGVCSYAMYKLLATVVDKLESNRKISPKVATVLKNILKVRAFVLPTCMIGFCYKDPMQLNGIANSMETVLSSCILNSSLIAPELTLWEMLQAYFLKR